MADNRPVYTKELNDIVKYVTSTLISKYPSSVITPDYYIYAFLKMRNCTVNGVLVSYMTTSNEKDMVMLYSEVLEKHMLSLPLDDSIIPVDSEELTKCFSDAINEMNEMQETKLCSIHLFLALLNPINGETPISRSFNAININYDRIKSKYQSALYPPSKTNNSTPSSSTANKKQKKAEPNPQQQQQNSNEAINEYTRDLTQLAKEGKVDNLIGREKELNKLISTLARRRKNNAVIIGLGGVGKSAIVNGLAHRITKGNVPEFLKGKKILSLNILSIVGGTTYRGMFEERVNKLFTELENSKSCILFIDDMQQIFKSGGREKDGDMSGMITRILENGNIRVIGTMTTKDYRNAIESNSSLSSRFQKIVVEQCTIPEAEHIINKVKDDYEKFHKVRYTPKALSTAVIMAERYFPERCLPDSAIDVIDVAGAKATMCAEKPKDIEDLKSEIQALENNKQKYIADGKWDDANYTIKSINEKKSELANKNREYEEWSNTNFKEITEVEISEAISELTSIPVSKMSTDERQKIIALPDILKKNVIGQDEAIDKICKLIKRNKAGLGIKDKPIASVLAIGGTGVGKTLIAKKLAEELFGTKNALIRIDMSEYSDKSSVSKLTGSNPGYVGFENGGYLTEAVKNKKYCVLLLDEIEKANEEVYNLFLQLFDEGRLTDSAGQTVNFKNVIVIMTSNVGAREAASFGGGIGFSKDSEATTEAILRKKLEGKFTPEFLNRLDGIIYFNSLDEAQIKKIVELELNKLKERVAENSVSFTYDDNVVDFIAEKANEEKKFGARPIIRIIESEITDKLTDEILSVEQGMDVSYTLTCENNTIMVRKSEK